MIDYLLEWSISMLMIRLFYMLFGREFEKEDVYLFTVIWGVANLCISLNHHG